MQSASLEETFDNIESAIISGYLQILYAQEAVLINQKTVEVSKAQCERGEKLKNAGTLSERYRNTAAINTNSSFPRTRWLKTNSLSNNYWNSA